jgi:hypothetical protein
MTNDYKRHIMRVQDIGQYIYNRLINTKNFFRFMLALATVRERERELSRVEDETVDSLIKKEQPQKRQISTTAVVEAELKRLQAEVQSAKSKCSDYLKKPREDQMDFEFLELVINVQTAVKNSIQICHKLQASHTSDMVSKQLSEQLSEFETSAFEITQIIIRIIPRAKISVLEYARGLFALENVEQALAEASEKAPNYIEIFDTISDHLLPDDGMDEEEWLQKFGYYVDKMFNSYFEEEDKRVKPLVEQFHFIKTITRSDISAESRQVLLKLLETFNSILRIYALDERYKKVAISIQPSEVHKPVQNTIQDLHEDINAWFISYHGTWQNSHKNGNLKQEDSKKPVRFVAIQSDSQQGTKAKKTVRFAPENQTLTKIVNESDPDEILGNRVGVEKLKQGGRIPGAIERSIKKNLMPLGEKLQNLRSHKPKRRTRRASTFGDRPAKPRQ